MKVALGFKAHSGWAAVVVVGRRAGEFVIVDRFRMELVDALWAKAPFHAAEEMQPHAARKLVERGIAAAHRIAEREMRAILEREQSRGNSIAACALLTGEPMPAWSIDEIRAVHFRMHKAEGALFRDALAQAAASCGIKLVEVRGKELGSQAEAALATSMTRLSSLVAKLGKSIGPPWAKDQKDAALTAMIALVSHPAT